MLSVAQLGERLANVRIGSVRYNSPWTQVVILGFVAFCSVGMFSAISNLGAGGAQDVQLADTANAVLYGVFAISGPFAGSINNTLGPRATLSLGTIGYSIYVGSLWAFQVHGTRAFFIVAGGILGFTAAMLWAAQGAIMMSYPEEKDKGRAFSIFWSIFQAGTLVGAAIALGIQAHSTLPAVSNGVYVVFMVIQLTAIFTSWLILPPNLVVRGDGTVVEVAKSLTVKEEVRQFLLLCKDWRMIALFPMFFSSNYFYAYQGAINANCFNGRTRALVALLTGAGSIVGSIFMGMVLDYVPLKRRNRALFGAAVCLLLNLIVWAGGLAFQVTFVRADGKFNWDWSDGKAPGPIILLMAYYIADAAFQGLAYYTMSAMTNDPFKLARMAGYYKGVQSAGSAVSFGMDAVKTAFLAEHLISWFLLLVSFPFVFFVLWKCRDTNYDVERVVHVEELEKAALHGAALPPGHHMHQEGEVPAALAGEGNEKDQIRGDAVPTV